MCVLGLNYYELQFMDEEVLNDLMETDSGLHV